jgi:hypothetical protein
LSLFHDVNPNCNLPVVIELGSIILSSLVCNCPDVPVTVVAVVAVDAFPDNVAVIVPALKLPDALRATTLLAVLASVASTAKVLAVDPLNVPAEVKNDPAVRAAVVAFAVVADVAVDAFPCSEPVNPAVAVTEFNVASDPDTITFFHDGILIFL